MTTPPAPAPSKSKAERRTRVVMILLGLLIPTLSLVPFGSVWLWQQGYLLYWAVFALLSIVGTYWLQRYAFPPPPKSQPASTPPAVTGDAGLEHGWSPLEEQAMSDVLALANSVDPERMTTWDGAVELGREAIEIVAKRLHPERRDPVWQFTPPEALAIVERVSRRLRLFTVDKVPFGDRITVAQALTLYRWRGAADYAEKAYDIWRILRLANPITAVTHEARERLSGELVQWGRNEVAGRLAQAYVREIGRAAIDLYSGRLRVTSASLSRHVSSETAADAAAIGATRAEPLRILVAGQISAGKSSLINALADQAKAAVDALPATAGFTPYAIEREGFPAALIIDSAGLAHDARATSDLIDRAADCDLVLWVAGAHRPDRELDRRAIDAYREHFASRLNRRRPPMILVLTHIDRLRPFAEWSPPYDIANGTDAKSENIRAAIGAAAADLGFAASDPVPVSLLPKPQTYNVEAVWQRIAAELPEATRAQLLRCLSDLKGGWDWSTLLSQTSNAGRAIVRSLSNRKHT
jgi:predicted GTPase